MNAKKILVPVDFSPASAAGLVEATALARDLGATLVFLHVEEAAIAYASGENYYGPPEPTGERLWEMLTALVPADKNVPYEHRLEMGDPVEEILRVAKEENADLIVIGTHGRTGLKRLVMGSVAEAVVRRAPCPVMTYRAALPAPGGRKEAGAALRKQAEAGS